jgi:hypothetical protein
MQGNANVERDSGYNRNALLKFLECFRSVDVGTRWPAVNQAHICLPLPLTRPIVRRVQMTHRITTVAVQVLRAASTGENCN